MYYLKTKIGLVFPESTSLGFPRIEIRWTSFVTAVPNLNPSNRTHEQFSLLAYNVN